MEELAEVYNDPRGGVVHLETLIKVQQHCVS